MNIIGRKAFNYLTRDLVEQQSKINIITGGLTSRLDILLTQKYAKEIQQSMNSTFTIFDLQLNSYTLPNGRELCATSIANKAQFAVDTKHRPLYFRRWTMLKEFMKFHSTMGVLNSPMIKPDFLIQQLNEISDILSGCTTSDRKHAPLLFIQGGETLKSLEALETSCNESQHNREFVEIFLNWLNDLTTRERDKQINVLIVAQDKSFLDWLKHHFATVDLSVHVLGYLDKADAKAEFDALLTEHKAQNREDVDFEGLYKIVGNLALINFLKVPIGGDVGKMRLFLEALIFKDTVYTNNNDLFSTNKKFFELICSKKGEVSPYKPLLSRLSNPIVGWDPELFKAILTEISDKGYVHYSKYAHRATEIKSILDIGILDYYGEKPINNNEFGLNEPFIAANSPMEKYCIQQVLHHLNHLQNQPQGSPAE